ncbi:MAG: tetratricopeptide repeat protein [Nitrospinae bacterium]|nr:tetratricopeptide repeat protein [Nitrospinota bacterium]MBL7019783.1 tetratricopeptide repeat protein [Nitrospinaceae bacterium]
MAEDFSPINRLLKGRVFPLILFFVILTGETTLSRHTEIDRQYQQANTLAELEHIAGKVRKYLEQEPDNLEWQWRLARSHYSIAKRSEDTHHYDLCIEHSSRALKIKPDSAIGYFFRALCRGKKGEMQGIWSSLGIIEPFEEDMKKALDLDPSIQNGGPNRALGILYLELPFFLGGSTDRAIFHLKEAVRLSPNHAENHLGLAQAYYAKNNFASARKSLSTLLSLTDNVSDEEDLLKLRTKGQELLEKMAYDSYTYD